MEEDIINSFQCLKNRIISVDFPTNRVSSREKTVTWTKTNTSTSSCAPRRRIAARLFITEALTLAKFVAEGQSKAGEPVDEGPEEIFYDLVAGVFAICGYGACAGT